MMSQIPKEFSEKLVQCEPYSPKYKKKYEKEKRAMFEKRLGGVQRGGYVFWTVFGLSLGILFGVTAFVSYGELPILGTLVFAAGSVFGLAFAAMSASIAITGRLLLRKHPPAMAGSAWAFTVIVMTFCLVTAPSLPDPAVGNRMLLSGLAFFVMAAVFLLASRTEQSELNVKEKLLEIEYRLAELTEKVDPSSKGP